MTWDSIILLPCEIDSWYGNKYSLPLKHCLLKWFSKSLLVVSHSLSFLQVSGFEYCHLYFTEVLSLFLLFGPHQAVLITYSSQHWRSNGSWLLQGKHLLPCIISFTYRLYLFPFVPRTMLRNFALYGILGTILLEILIRYCRKQNSGGKRTTLRSSSRLALDSLVQNL